MGTITINAGRAAMVPKGRYSSSVSYEKLDVVSYNSSGWLCIQDCTGVTPAENSEYWQLLASGSGGGGGGEEVQLVQFLWENSDWHVIDWTLATLNQAIEEGVPLLPYISSGDNAYFGSLFEWTEDWIRFAFLLPNEGSSPTYTVNSTNLLVLQVYKENDDTVVATAFNKGIIDTSSIYDYVKQSDWNQTNTLAVDFIKNKPLIPAAQIQSDWNQTNVLLKDYIKNKPTIPAAQVQSDWTEADNTKVDYIKNKPSLATVATSGSYTDLSNKPTIPDLSTYCPIIEDGRSSSVAAITGTAPFATLEDGQRIVLHFKYRNEASPTLQLTLSGGTTTSALPLYQNYNSGLGALTVQAMPANSYGEFIYDQTNSRWMLIGKDVNTTYSPTTQADINNSAQGSRLIEPALLRTNFYLKSEAQAKRTVQSETVSSGSVTVALDATKYHLCDDDVSSITMTLPATYTAADEFIVEFECTAASPTITLPSGVTLADNFDWSEAAAGVVFQVSIVNDIAAYLCLTPTP